MKKVIIRKGDIVRVDNPLFFIRCGYPLSSWDMAEEIEKNFGDVITDLIHSAGGDKLMRRDPTGKYEDGTVPYDSYRQPYSAVHAHIVKELAYIRLKTKRFGGDIRSMFTQLDERLKGNRAEVIKIKYVKTGERVEGTGGCGIRSCNSDEWDYDSPYLKNQKTHKILSLSWRGCKIENEILLDKSYEIEAIHVSKLYSKEEFEQMCGILPYIEPENSSCVSS